MVRRFFECSDGVVLPAMRLALLVSFWAGRDRSRHGGSLALWWSGLSYQHENDRPNHPTKQTSTTPSATTTIQQTNLLPLFVLFAHRRWLQREAFELLWNKIGKGLLAIHGETTNLWSLVNERLSTEYRRYRLAIVIASGRACSLSKQRSRRLREILLLFWTDHFQNHLHETEDDEGEDNEQKRKTTAAAAATTTLSEASSPLPCPLCGKDQMVVPYRVDCCGGTACYVCLWEHVSTTLAAASTRAKAAAAKTIPCPLCYQDIRKCSPI